MTIEKTYNQTYHWHNWNLMQTDYMCVSTVIKKMYDNVVNRRILNISKNMLIVNHRVFNDTTDNYV